MPASVTPLVPPLKAETPSKSSSSLPPPFFCPPIQTLTLNLDRRRTADAWFRSEEEMTPRARHAVESCALQLHGWKPFSDAHAGHHLRAKKPCLSDRSTNPDALDLSRLSLDEQPPPCRDPRAHGFRWIARKRRRRGSRSVSGRSSDRSGTRRAAYATCSDFPLAAGGTDSSGELFDASWGSDVSEAMRASGKRGEGKETGGERGAVLERESLVSGLNAGGGVGGAAAGALELQGNESGYGSEPGYRGDGELGYDDEIDEEEDDGKLLFWGGSHGGIRACSKFCCENSS